MIHEHAKVGFGRGAEAYERGRPGYPPEAIDWLAERLGLRAGRTVLDVGAGTGKLTAQLVATGARVWAVEPVPEMRAVLERVAAPARVLDGTAEALPVADATLDAVTVAQAFHWFDGPAALDEFHRVLGPKGRLALIYNRRRREEPLNAAISEIIEPYRCGAPTHNGGGWRAAFERTELFTAAGDLRVPFEQRVDAGGLVDRVASISFVAAASAAEREEMLARVRRLAHSHPPPLVLGYVTEVYLFARSTGRPGERSAHRLRSS